MPSRFMWIRPPRLDRLQSVYIQMPAAVQMPFLLKEASPTLSLGPGTRSRSLLLTSPRALLIGSPFSVPVEPSISATRPHVVVPAYQVLKAIWPPCLLLGVQVPPGTLANSLPMALGWTHLRNPSLSLLRQAWPSPPLRAD